MNYAQPNSDEMKASRFRVIEILKIIMWWFEVRYLKIFEENFG